MLDSSHLMPNASRSISRASGTESTIDKLDFSAGERGYVARQGVMDSPPLEATPVKLTPAEVERLCADLNGLVKDVPGYDPKAHWHAREILDRFKAASWGPERLQRVLRGEIPVIKIANVMSSEFDNWFGPRADGIPSRDVAFLRETIQKIIESLRRAALEHLRQ
jgi:hypothetical protein